MPAEIAKSAEKNTMAEAMPRPTASESPAGCSQPR